MLGPGKYESVDRPDAYNKTISWNLGKIPFQSGDERFKADYKQMLKPGPASYDAKKLARNNGSPQ